MKTRPTVRSTRDGSNTLHRADLGAFYHSVHGAWTETQHVFGEMGLKPWLDEALIGGETRPVEVLEVGFGTGLNALCAMNLAAASTRSVHMLSLEPEPLAWPEVEPLGFDELTGVASHLLRQMHETGQVEVPRFSLARVNAKVEEAILDERRFDVIFFDAFAPSAQPELWSVPVMDRLRCALRPGGWLVTYCAKGDVRRTLEAAGFQVERLPGPPGKREMLRATRPSKPQGVFNVRVYMVVTRTSERTGEQEVLVSYERLPMGGVMKFPGGGLEWGEGAKACIRREALEELGQAVQVGELLHVSEGAHVSSFDPSHQVVAVHYEANLEGPVAFDDDGVLEDVFGKRIALMTQRLGWRNVHELAARDFSFASDREAWEAWLRRHGR